MIESPHRVMISYSHDGIVDSIVGIWDPTECERTAAWDMYVELITRIPVAYVKPGEGSLRIGLSSLYKLFDASREIMRQYGHRLRGQGMRGNFHSATFPLNSWIWFCGPS
jgi:hypothetical protein